VGTNMKFENGFYIWTKGERATLGHMGFFDTHEFDCRCTYSDCAEQRVSSKLINRLENVRIEHRGPVVVTNGFRCHKHQADLTNNPNVETVQNSQHLLGNAADITSNRVRELGQLLPRYFHAIGTGLHGFHVDTRDDKERRWTYSKGL
jgi:uncharacterized protein YcbK (DUF882 family)